MSINNTNYKQMSLNRNSLKFDILKLMTKCRQNIRDHPKNIQTPMIKFKSKSLTRIKNVSLSLQKSIQPKNKTYLPKLVNRSVEKMKRNAQIKSSRLYSQQNHPSLNLPYKYKSSTQNPEQILFQINKLHLCDILSNKTLEKNLKQLSKNYSRSLKSLKSKQIIKQHIFTIPNKLLQKNKCLTTQLSKHITKELIKSKCKTKAINLITNQGWNIDHRQFDDIQY